MTMSELRSRRTGSGISGRTLCLKAQVDRTKLSHYEQQYLIPTAAEMTRLERALEELIHAKQRVTAFAAETGWPAATL